MRSQLSSFSAALLAVVTTACGARLGSGGRVEPVAITATPPGRVVALVAVSDHGAAPEDLASSNFEVREGDVPLDSSQVALKVQSLGEVRGHEAVVLVDASRAFSQAERAPLGAGLARLVDRLRFHQSVTLLAY